MSSLITGVKVKFWLFGSVIVHSKTELHDFFLSDSHMVTKSTLKRYLNMCLSSTLEHKSGGENGSHLPSYVLNSICSQQVSPESGGRPVSKDLLSKFLLLTTTDTADSY